MKGNLDASATMDVRGIIHQFFCRKSSKKNKVFSQCEKPEEVERISTLRGLLPGVSGFVKFRGSRSRAPLRLRWNPLLGQRCAARLTTIALVSSFEPVRIRTQHVERIVQPMHHIAPAQRRTGLSSASQFRRRSSADCRPVGFGHSPNLATGGSSFNGCAVHGTRNLRRTPG
ncbi:hypothetical protein [Burkholderia anthina]|uniref:hypothetical protein n=1 Tax=Burkholderia anthina TaxID=179879 RepID=UPI00158F03C7|nr:hypothetical protein [Burkholderia anthina]